MLPQASKELLARMRFFWKPLFQGRYLLLTNTVTCGGMLALGDCVQQTWEIYKDPSKVRSWKRTGCMFAVGTALGPCMHYWYQWLDRLYPGRAMKTVTKKVLIDQLIGSPTIWFGFFIGMSVTEGHTVSEGLEEFKEKFWEFYKADWCVWPPAQIINFYFLPPKFRVIYMNFVTLGWDVYISYLKHRVSLPSRACVCVRFPQMWN
uniref:MPV17 mitochondrial inner membrane protein like 2 n=1 Tax=Tetraodon nigroviridis TaxID=99883 RepID=H3CXV8_TETNG